MKSKIVILEPARDFIVHLDTKLRAKTFRTIELLQEFGPELKGPHSKKITGVKNLYELRIRSGSDTCRLFYFHHSGSLYVIASGFVKKDQKLKKSQIEKAAKIMRLYKGE